MTKTRPSIVLTLLGAILFAAPSWAVDQQVIDATLSGGMPTPPSMQSLQDQHITPLSTTLCGNSQATCNPLTDTSTLQQQQGDTQGLQQKGQQAGQTDPTVKIINGMPTVRLDPSDPTYSNLHQLIQGADKSLTAGSCPQTAPTTTVCERGYMSTKTVHQLKTLMLSVTPPWFQPDPAYSLWIDQSDKFGTSGTTLYYAITNADFTTTPARFQIGGIAWYRYKGQVIPVNPNYVWVSEGQNFNIQLNGEQNANSGCCATTIFALSVSGIFQNGVGTVTFSSSGGNATLTARYGAPVAADSWGIGDDTALPGGCTQTKSVCTDGPSSKFWPASDGKSYPFQRDCWQYDTTYACRAGNYDTCSTVSMQPSCRKVDSQCLKSDDAGCTQIRETWQCGGDCQSIQQPDLSTFIGSVASKTDPNGNLAVTATQIAILNSLYHNMNTEDACVACNDLQTKKEQARQAYTANPLNTTLRAKYDQAVADFQACLQKNCADLDQSDPSNWKSITIFPGKQQECKRTIGCDECSCHGVCDLVGICNPDNKKALVKLLQNGLCHFVGSHSTKTIGIVTQLDKRYCCFGSKLARILHEQGRPQMGWDWGSYDAPQCQGFSFDPNDAHYFGRLDFSRMDLSEFTNDIKNTMKLPDPSTLTNTVAPTIQQQQIQGGYSIP